MANGSVYVFNVFSQTQTLSPNGLSAGTINGWAKEYTPAVLKVARVLHRSDAAGKFYNGTNLVIIQWEDGLFSAQVPISGDQFPIHVDLLLYISRNTWEMYNTFGVRVSSGEVQGGDALARESATSSGH